ncbi:ribosomal protein L22e [Ramicandelaber brevisporus]|nr:ribosomal protein L22e [Ramicandelaber brevisporus]
MAPVVRAKKAVLKYYVDVSLPVADGILDIAAFEKYLQDRIKVDGLTNNLGSKVNVSREGDVKIHVLSTTTTSKRYIKYLTKKFLKKNQLRDHIRVTSLTKNGYKLKYYQTGAADE